MKRTALKKSNATKYTFYFPFDKKERTISEIKEKVLDFVKTVFQGATIYNAEGIYVPENSSEKIRPQNEDRQRTYVLEILVEDLTDKETRIEQLAWMILGLLDNLNLSKEKNREKSVWFYEQPATLYKLDNPDLERDENEKN